MLTPHADPSWVTVVRPIAVAVAFAIGLWALSKFGGEQFPKIILGIFAEVRKLIQGERSTKSVNALTLILGFLAMVLLLGSPIKDVVTGAGGQTPSDGTSIFDESLIGFLIFCFIGAGLISMRISQFEKL